MVEYTPDVTFPSSATTCQVATSGSVYQMTCVIERSVRRITMKGNFNTEVAAGSEIDLIIGKFSNPMTEGSSSFVVSLYSD